MAGKLDKVNGVFVLHMEDEKCSYVYIGKSTGVGVALRSAKSKLRKNKFHNSDFQDDFRKYGMGVNLYEETVLCKEGESIREAFKRTKDEWIDLGWLLYNDIEFIYETETITKSELTSLTPYEQKFVRLVIEKINKIDIDYLTTQINGE